MKAIIVFVITAILINQSFSQDPINFTSSSHLKQDSLIQYNVSSENDSIRYYKEEYSNYQGENWTVFVSSFWDTTNFVWIPDFRLEYNYNSDGSYTLRARFDYNIVREEWIPRDKYTNEYNDVGTTLNSLLIRWDTTLNEWTNIWKQEYIINDIENTRLQNTYDWSFESNEWIPDQQVYYQHSVDGTIQSFIRSKWIVDQEEWELQRKIEYVHNSVGDFESSLSFKWSMENNEWIEYAKNTRNYNEEDRIQTLEYFTWDDDAANWLLSTKYLNQFDANENLILDEYYTANESIPRQRYTFEYDDFNRLLKHNYYGIDGSMNHLNYRSYDQYLYEQDGSKMLRRRFYWESQINDWVFYISEISYFSATSGIPYESISSVSIFPNPTSGGINIIGLTYPAEIEILNIEGRIVKTISNVKTAIDASGLPPGLYILRIKSGNESIVKRIVIE